MDNKNDVINRLENSYNIVSEYANEISDELDRHFLDVENKSGDKVNRLDLITIDGCVLRQLVNDSKATTSYMHRKSMDENYSDKALANEIFLSGCILDKHIEIFDCNDYGVINDKPEIYKFSKDEFERKINAEDLNKTCNDYLEMTGFKRTDGENLLHDIKIPRVNDAFLDTTSRYEQYFVGRKLVAMNNVVAVTDAYKADEINALAFHKLAADGMSIADIANPDYGKEQKADAVDAVKNMIDDNDLSAIEVIIKDGRSNILNQIDDAMKDVSFESNNELFDKEFIPVFAMSDAMKKVDETFINSDGNGTDGAYGNNFNELGARSKGVYDYVSVYNKEYAKNMFTAMTNYNSSTSKEAINQMLNVSFSRSSLLEEKKKAPEQSFSSLVDAESAFYMRKEHAEVSSTEDVVKNQALVDKIMKSAINGNLEKAQLVDTNMELEELAQKRLIEERRRIEEEQRRLEEERRRELLEREKLLRENRQRELRQNEINRQRQMNQAMI